MMKLKKNFKSILSLAGLKKYKDSDKIVISEGPNEDFFPLEENIVRYTDELIEYMIDNIHEQLRIKFTAVYKTGNYSQQHLDGICEAGLHLEKFFREMKHKNS
jgi:hypothetical protein